MNIKRKGGQIEVISILLVPILILFMCIIAVVLYKTIGSQLSSMKPTMNDAAFNESSEALVSQGQSSGSFFDFIFILVIFGVWLIEMISSFILGNSPLFLLIYFLSSFVIFIIGIIVKIVMKHIISVQTLQAFMVEMPMTVWVVDHFILISVIWIVSIGVVLYGKSGNNAEPTQ